MRTRLKGLVMAAATATTALTGLPAGDAPVERATPMDWVQEQLHGAGLEIPETLTFRITDEGNCGSEASPGKTGGGCTYLHADGSAVIYLSPSALNDRGRHVLFHEYAHSVGIIDECAAERFSHKYSNPEVWSYPHCKYERQQ